MGVKNSKKSKIIKINRKKEQELYPLTSNSFEFKEDKEYNGDGYIYYRNGEIYNGHIENGMKNEKGKFIY